MENRRVLLALGLSFIVIFAWSALFAPPPPRPLVGPPEPERSAPLPEAVESAPRASSTVGAEDAGDVAPAEAGASPREVRVRTDLYTATVRSLGGVLSGFTLERYAAAPPRPGQLAEPLDLVDVPSGPGVLAPLGVTSGDSSADAVLATANFVVEGDDVKLTGAETATLVLRWSDGSGSRVEKRIEFRGDSYVLGVRVRARLADIRQPFLVLAPGLVPGAERGHTGAYAERAAYLPQGGKPKRILRQAYPVKELRDRAGGLATSVSPEWLRTLETLEKVHRHSELSWAGVDSNYFAAVAFAESPLREVLVLPAPVATEERDARMGVLLALPDGEAQLSIFCGPKDPELLRSVRPDLARVVDFGFFELPALYLLAALKFFYRYVHNYGIAIILLTICVKAVFLPLTIKQLSVAQKMAKLRPQLKDIENRYARAKGDAHERMEANRKMREEQMALYTREGVNPMGGCLPLLVQLPIFYGFYSLLGVSIELRHAPFALWIQDLSAKDPFYVTPALMVLSMIVLQSITPAMGDPTQRRMMLLMPLVFGFFFKDLASGLVLYWLTQNVISLLQQVYMNRLALERERREKESRRLEKKRGQKGD